MKMTDASLKGKVKNLAREHGLSAQEVLQMYLLERLLSRLAASKYADRVVLKGGMLIASLCGVARRTTMDMDTTIIGIPMEEVSISALVEDVCAIYSDDGITFSFERLTPIREEDEYANFRAHIRANFGKISAPCKIDITTGDVITPAAIRYPYQPIFDDETIGVLSYPPETIIAEKFETLIRRGEENSRARDFYDATLLLGLYRDKVDWSTVRGAIMNTAEKRGSAGMMPQYREVLDGIRFSEYIISTVWEPYAKA
ncbi:MAG: nucleotidyl transferase AbiEii/AbiGii toxin family protein, partial [Cloacibacillus sp.]